MENSNQKKSVKTKLDDAIERLNKAISIHKEQSRKLEKAKGRLIIIIVTCSLIACMTFIWAVSIALVR